MEISGKNEFNGLNGLEGAEYLGDSEDFFSGVEEVPGADVPQDYRGTPVEHRALTEDETARIREELAEAFRQLPDIEREAADHTHALFERVEADLEDTQDRLRELIADESSDLFEK